MKYIIIGLGNYGGVLAEELSVLGHEVIGVDTNMGHRTKRILRIERKEYQTY